MRFIVGKNSQPSERKLFFGNFLFGILVAIARGEAKRRGSRTSILTWKVVLSIEHSFCVSSGFNMVPQCLHVGSCDGFRLIRKCWSLIQSNLNHCSNQLHLRTSVDGDLNISELGV